ncbi:PLP-dependent aminotransferase family protein [Puniceicoccales bacterium CK1056]|uniref:PLP-dependent aminotransferase family protein n=1 Tax=Oceanipulchritudo coccoides TaxID=2706888 RepID=A0A6B2M3B1_9BACT|nr:PLP-dependent aminotransferase family protein [Oceanipulchritudo coccoides]NDV62567.1 PLP-dependent aminotransferase family protein [Oceanipulchritudo coccoides]
MSVERPESRLSFSTLGSCARGIDSVITRLMAAKLAQPEMLSLAAGFTDNGLLPQELVGEAVAHLAGTEKKAHFQYGMNRGRPGLRNCVIDLLKTYPGEASLSLSPENILITNGSQQGLYILVQMLCDPGDIVLVESPSYFVFLELLKGLGVKAVSIPMDAEGRIDADGLQALIDTYKADGIFDRVKLVYLMGAYANPSTRCIDESEKAALAGVLHALERPIPVIEDMAYRELYFEEPFPARSLLAMSEWDDYPVIYAGTFTKPFATGMKVGFIVSRDRECLDTVASIKGHQDFGTAHFPQAILEYVLSSGAYSAHLSHIRQAYMKKRDLLESALEEHGFRDAGWSWQQPRGGLLLWARGPEGTDTRIGSAFHRICLEKEILYVPGDLCFAEGSPHGHVRLSFGALESALIPEAARRFCEAALAAEKG